MSLVEQELHTLPEHLSSGPVFSGVRDTRSLVLYVCCRSLFVLLSFFCWSLYRLFFFDIRIMITPLASVNSSNVAYRCVVLKSITISEVAEKFRTWMWMKRYLTWPMLDGHSILSNVLFNKSTFFVCSIIWGERWLFSLLLFSQHFTIFSNPLLPYTAWCSQHLTLCA